MYLREGKAILYDRKFFLFHFSHRILSTQDKKLLYWSYIAVQLHPYQTSHNNLLHVYVITWKDTFTWAYVRGEKNLNETLLPEYHVFVCEENLFPTPAKASSGQMLIQKGFFLLCAHSHFIQGFEARAWPLGHVCWQSNPLRFFINQQKGMVHPG